MSDNGTREFEEHGGLTAAEYVLGVLNARERRAAAQRIARDSAFAAEVAFWEERLGGLAAAVPLVAPPADSWARIETALARAGPRPTRSEGLWQSLSFWRSLAIGASALAVASLAGLIYMAQAPTLKPPLVAKLDEASGKSGFFAASNPADGTLTIVPAVLLTGEEKHALELWVIPSGGKPHSLGLVDPARPIKVVVPPELRPHVTADSVLAISVEPPGGSPTGQPTGPVIANGKLAAL
jgi:anti-sigma-K factor RskA